MCPWSSRDGVRPVWGTDGIILRACSISAPLTSAWFSSVSGSPRPCVLRTDQMQLSTPSLGTLVGFRDSIPRDFLEARTLSFSQDLTVLWRSSTFNFDLYFIKIKLIELWGRSLHHPGPRVLLQGEVLSRLEHGHCGPRAPSQGLADVPYHLPPTSPVTLSLRAGLSSQPSTRSCFVRAYGQLSIRGERLGTQSWKGHHSYRTEASAQSHKCTGIHRTHINTHRVH